MTTRFTAPIGAEPAEWTKKPTPAQIDATGRALEAGTRPTDEEQIAWFGAVVFDEPPTYRAGAWHVGDSSFSSHQIARAAAEDRRLGGQ